MANISNIIHETDAHGTFTEFLHATPDARYAVLAPHGGQVEPNTDTETILLAQHLEDASVWGTRGIVNDNYGVAFTRWHTTGQTHPRSVFPLYQQLANDTYTAACSLHVMQEGGLIIGGRAPESARKSLRDHLAIRFPDEDIRLGVTGEPRAGMNPENFVNALDTDHPIHIEQSFDIATTHPAKLARAIAAWLTTYEFE